MSASRHGSTFAWQRFFQRSTEPLFVLNRQGYVLFVNRAWEQLTGLPAAQAKRLSCRRPQPVPPDASWRTFLAHVLTPPDLVLEGSAAAQRRLIPARQGRPPCWWVWMVSFDSPGHG